MPHRPHNRVLTLVASPIAVLLIGSAMLVLSGALVVVSRRQPPPLRSAPIVFTQEEYDPETRALCPGQALIYTVDRSMRRTTKILATRTWISAVTNRTVYTIELPPGAPLPAGPLGRARVTDVLVPGGIPPGPARMVVSVREGVRHTDPLISETSSFAVPFEVKSPSECRGDR